MRRTASNWAKKIYVVGKKSQKCQKCGRWSGETSKTGVFVCMVSDTRNKVLKQHIAGKILAMQHMSLLLKMFNFIVKRLPFSWEVRCVCMVLLYLVFFSNEPNSTGSASAEKWQTWGPNLVVFWDQVQTLGCLLGVGISKWSQLLQKRERALSFHII